MTSFLQANVNHSRVAQDLAVQTMRERGIGVMVLAEPHGSPGGPSWVTSESGGAAITWDPVLCPWKWSRVVRGRDFVMTVAEELAIMECYLPPNRPINDFADTLEAMAGSIRGLPRHRVVVLGDFNAKSPQWGSSLLDRRGEILEQWAQNNALRLANRGTVSTCHRWQGESVVDITWCSPDLVQWVQGWKVEMESETLSDHRYIVFSLSPPSRMAWPRGGTDGRGSGPFPRWSDKRIDLDLFRAAVVAGCWLGSPPASVEDRAEWIRDRMQDACDVGMPRVGNIHGRRRAYWWSDHLASLRANCNRCRRLLTRARRRRRGTRIQDLELALNEARMELKREICRAKSRAWAELIEMVDSDPWGRPYRTVMSRIRPAAPPLTESIGVEVLDRVIEDLFPSMAVLPEQSLWVHWDQCWEVSEDEVSAAIRRSGSRNAAPGRDGVTGRVWRSTPTEMTDILGGCYSQCLRVGVFPSAWKVARLILLKKKEGPLDSASTFRPICLLDEAGKIFERILAARIKTHLAEAGGLSEAQYGFREGRSTCDAVLHVRRVTEEASANGWTTVAIGLDIRNAFNSLPWDHVRSALERWSLPPYLRRILGSYLSDRHLEYVDGSGELRCRRVTCGVPQGSVLGPLLWNITFDGVVSTALPPDCEVVCYADDTLILAKAKGPNSASDLATTATAIVVARIRQLNLSVASGKTEVMGFRRVITHRFITRRPSVDGVLVTPAYQLRYLGLTLDGCWRLGGHFLAAAAKADKVVAALGRIMPNLRGPCENRRQLFMSVVHSVLLYGAPVWADIIEGKKTVGAALAKVQRRMALRVIAGYSTVSYEAAGMLARVPPIDLLATKYRSIYKRVRELRGEGAAITERAVSALSSQADEEVMDKWKARLRAPGGASSELREALVPHLDEWMTRAHGGLTYRVTQILTGHGCFGTYLHRIGREASPACHHCGGLSDSALHTLAECPTWDAERAIMWPQDDGPITMSGVIGRMLSGPENWRAVSQFCEKVMRTKEEAEREREPTRLHRQQTSQQPRVRTVVLRSGAEIRL